MAPENFPDLMRALPQELFTEIYDLVFATPLKDHCVRIDQDYKPPVQLQVDRTSRAAYAESYYSNTTFVLDDSDLGSSWGQSLERQHFDSICHFRVPNDEVPEDLRHLKTNRNFGLYANGLEFACFLEACVPFAFDTSADYVNHRVVLEEIRREDLPMGATWIMHFCSEGADLTKQ